MKHSFLRLFTALFLSVILFAHVAVASSGFVDSPLWLTPESPKDGQTATLSAVFRNAESDTLSGSILFYDNDTLLAKKPVTILSGQVGTVATSFNISAGSHQFSATMSNMNKLTNSGKLEVVVIPLSKVQLPEQFISKTVLSAQAGGAGSTDSEGLILNQIDKAEQNVLSVVPDSTKKSVSTTAQGLDGWRASQADSFTASREAAQAEVNSQKTSTTAPSAKNGSVIKSTSSSVPKVSEKSPFAYVKFILYSALAYLFSTPLLFYLLGLLLIFLILRFIFRKVSRRFGKGRASARPGKA